MDDEGLTPKKLERLVNAATNPLVAYRREICHRLARQTFNQFGMEGLYDLLGGIDSTGRMFSVVITDRNEVENYVFEKHGIFDPDMFEKIQLSDDWDEFIQELLEWSSERVVEIIDRTVTEG